jgi:hypothetical protein
MSKIRGRDGKVKIATATVAAVVSFGIDQTMEPIDDSTLNDVDKTHVSGDTGWSGSIECMWDKADATGQGAMTIGASVSLVLHPEGDASGALTRSGTASITGISESNTKGAMVTQSFTFMGNGGLTVGAVA